ncbi:phosphoribosylglycinamide formyltransferase [Lentilitoribacter sp. Alg239-R112]|uniref:phosphoribosylglycinamide formyltransferase n=1 Tax=Lentilitoribacter sp. Alg239-R112 TaxID=2305987 RepID=UPI0013A6E6ED|nr:phosphoribosylglycinamide formyltransferase [Lentilitoribacter sp. Alg239-R112]
MVNQSDKNKKIGILISGGGTNMQALAQACLEADYPAEVKLVISDKADAGGLARAEKLGIQAIAIPRKDFDSKAAHETAILTALGDANLDFLCLAGYMRLLSEDFIKVWQGRMINIHPSILPLFAGLNTHQRAIDAGCRVHGCSVHFVTAGMDEGPIISQAIVPILPDDNADTLAARVIKVEHQLYPRCLKLLASGDVKMDDHERAIFGKNIKIDADQQLIS